MLRLEKVGELPMPIGGKFDASLAIPLPRQPLRLRLF